MVVGRRILQRRLAGFDVDLVDRGDRFRVTLRSVYGESRSRDFFYARADEKMNALACAVDTFRSFVNNPRRAMGGDVVHAS